MKQAITQQDEMGCGAACVACAAGVSYEKAVSILGKAKAQTTGFYLRDLTDGLKRLGLDYQYKHVKPSLKPLVYQEGSIVFIRRSKRYPYGHYLIRHNGQWMDPWINLLSDKQIEHARAGYRMRLPGRGQWVVFVSENPSSHKAPLYTS